MKLVVISYYFTERIIRSRLKNFDLDVSIFPIDTMASEFTDDCMDMTKYAEVFDYTSENNIIVLNDTLFKKLFWKATIKYLIKLSQNYIDITGIPILIGDLHSTADLNMSYHPLGKHVSTYAFYCNAEAKEHFLKIYHEIKAQELTQITKNPFYHIIEVRNFLEENSKYTWSANQKASNELLLRKLKAILIEFEFSKYVYASGVLIDLNDMKKIRILHRFRNLLKACVFK